MRYQRDFRGSIEEMRRVLVAPPSGAQIPLGQVTRISYSRGPAMIRNDGALTGHVYIDLKDANYGGFVAEASRRFEQKLKLPATYSFQWSGEFEFQRGPCSYSGL